MSEEYDRRFARRIITWKLTDVTRESIEEAKVSPQFSISLGNNKTKWNVQFIKSDQHTAVGLYKFETERTDFSVKFGVCIKSSSPNGKYFKSFSKSCTEIFKDKKGRVLLKFIPLDVLFDKKNELLLCNELTLEIQLELIEDSKVKMLEENFLTNNYEKLINNEQHSDFVFICSDGGKVYVQKANIAVHCEAFAAMIGAGLTETVTNTATITDVDSETMLELVRFMYCGRVNNMEKVQERLVIAANKYSIEQLKNLCVSSLMESLTVDNAHYIYEIAKLLGEDNLKENCIDFIKCYQSQIPMELKEKEFSKELLLAVCSSYDLKPIRINFENDKLM